MSLDRERIRQGIAEARRKDTDPAFGRATRCLIRMGLDSLELLLEIDERLAQLEQARATETEARRSALIAQATSQRGIDRNG